MWNVAIIRSNRCSLRASSTASSAACDVGNFGGLTEVEGLEFLTNQLVEPTVFLEEILVVETGQEQNVPDLEPHQFLERLDAGVEEIET